MTIFTLPIISLFAIYILISVKSKFHDTFYILAELKYIFICICVDHFGYIAANYVKYIPFVNDNSSQLKILESTLEFIGYFALFCALLFSTIYVTHKLQTIIQNDSYSVRTIKNVTVIALNNQLNRSNNDTADIKLVDVLSNNHGFELFMMHLGIELSTEILLCLVELIQFQQYVQRQNWNSSQCLKQSLFEWIEFPSCVPLSFIVNYYNEYSDLSVHNLNVHNLSVQLIDEYNQDVNALLRVLKVRARALFKKYIDSNAKYQVNLSYRIRRKIEVMIDDMMQKDDHEISMESLLYLFDDACNSLYSLMKDAFRRFSQTSKFNKLHGYLSRRSTIESVEIHKNTR